MKRAIFALLLAACGGNDFAAAAADAGDAHELVDAGAEVVVVVDAQRIDAGAELVDVAGELVVDAGAEVLVDVADELQEPADVAGERKPDAGDAEAAADPLICKSIDGTGMCSSTGPWPYPCCRSMPCECCNKPNCGADQ